MIQKFTLCKKMCIHIGGKKMALSESKIMQIQQLYIQGEKSLNITNKVGVSRATIFNLAKRYNWVKAVPIIAQNQKKIRQKLDNIVVKTVKAIEKKESKIVKNVIEKYQLLEEISILEAKNILQCQQLISEFLVDEISIKDLLMLCTAINRLRLDFTAVIEQRKSIDKAIELSKQEESGVVYVCEFGDGTRV